MRTISMIVFGALLGGCYGSAPPRPTRIVLPKRLPATPIVVNSKSTTRIEDVAKRSESCPRGVSSGHESCIVTRYSVKEPVTRTKTTAEYGGVKLNKAQFLVMTDPKYDKKLKQLEQHSKACVLANVPRWVGFGLLAAGAIAAGIAASQDIKGLTYGGIGAAGGGVASYSLGYYAFGGRRCNDAQHIYNDIQAKARQTNVTEVREKGSYAAKEMKALADRFNAAKNLTPTAASMSQPASDDDLGAPPPEDS